MSFRIDGLLNALTGIGGTQDRTLATTYALDVFQPDDVWSAIWASNGLGYKICSLQIDDMVRNWIEFPEDKEGKILAALDKLKVRESVQRLLYWTDLYGGALAVMILDKTGDDLAAPLSKGQETAPLVALRVFPAMRKRIINTPFDLVKDPSSPYFQDLEKYTIVPQDAGQDSQFEAHASRCIVSKGVPLPPDEYYEWRYRYWGVSRLQRTFTSLGNLDTVYNAFANLVHQITIGKVKIAGLRELLGANEEAEANLKALMDTFAKSVSYLNMILMADGDDFSRESLTFTGWKEVVQIFKERLATEQGYATSILFETSASAGLAASSSEQESTKRYNNSVKVRQETDLRPILQRIVAHVAPTVGFPPDIHFDFKSLDTPDPKTVAEIKKIHAETDQIRVNIGAIFPDEARSRLEGEVYSDEVVLNEAYSAKGQDEMDLETQLATAQKALADAQKAQGTQVVPTAPKAVKPLQMPKAPAPKGKTAK